MTLLRAGLPLATAALFSTPAAAAAASGGATLTLTPSAPGTPATAATIALKPLTPAAPQLTAAQRAATRAVAAARTRLGDPYRMGGTSPGGFDCSGLVLWSYGRAGVELPRTSYSQYGRGRALSRGQIRAGDLVFFDSSGPGASHAAIAVSRTHVISATSSGGVMVHPIGDAYWGGHYVGARRLGG